MEERWVITLLCFVGWINFAEAQLSAVVQVTSPTCTQPLGSATVVPTGGNNYSYKWNTGATTATLSGLAPGIYTVTVYSVTSVFDTIYKENFDGTHQWTLNIPTGSNGADNNYWVVTDTEGGMPAGSCRQQYNNDKTLYITSVSWPSWGAKYDAGGLCGILYCPETNMAAQSPNISTLGVNALQLLFEFMANGQGLTDNASLYFSIDGGNNFILLDASLKTTNCSGSNGRWGFRKYNLPVSANNSSQFKIRFNWTNNDDGIGTDPSVAVNNIVLRDSISIADSVVVSATISPPSLPVINTSNVIITLPACGQNNGSITGIAVSGGTAPYQVQWTLNGSIYSNTFPLLAAGAGIYTFEVTDALGCRADTTFTLASQGMQPATLTVSNDSICEGDTALICAPLGAMSYVWNTGATSRCIDASDPGKYAAIVIWQQGCTAVSDTVTITTLPLPQPFLLVKGDSLFASGGVAYQWYFNDNPITGATQPKHTAALSGNYYVLVTGANGCGVFSDTISVSLSAIFNQNLIADVSIYPVPFDDVLYIVSHQSESGEWYLVDMTGKIWYQVKSYYATKQIQTAHLFPGCYALIWRDDSAQKVFKLIKL